MSEIKETAVTVDHDLKTCLVDTNSKGMASKLKRLGFKLLNSEKSHPYWRFSGTARQISFRGANKKVFKKKES